MEMHTYWQMGTGRAGLVVLSLHSWLWLAECTAVLSPLPLDILSACLDVWALAGDLSGAGTWAQTSSVWSDYHPVPPPLSSLPYPLLPCNLNSHWSLTVVMFIFFFRLRVSVEGREGPVRRNEFPQQLRRSPLTDKHTSHTCVCLISLSMWRFLTNSEVIR